MSIMWSRGAFPKEKKFTSAELFFAAALDKKPFYMFTMTVVNKGSTKGVILCLTIFWF